MKITKKLREEAALCCQAAASNDWDRDDLDYDAGEEFFWHSQFTWNDQAADLALAAHGVACAAWRCGSEPWAEAEAMLRTGFVPEGWE